ncbi:MAG TPA: isoprenylcysteine carboxylmethyltransferase family protein [Cyclobacteriaceae bacterium]|nr:isoprenylcysteine carboxylmethyltransferase family protein [Cyclobacteriaceae bacterium]MCB9237610.1 isoprenylcysteine carboxylmethyltransferase family protein [Flammeovirgaceae bacterium]MCB0498876.1 isoprenylcysteine carboxylmethyltransferase family protein [Cyclobacteriaceae bacterium]MCO5270288.1 isoprenylcysteine carboxylmethyltransferase family protein [Cyclobacteriaceae bacterium]MCW5902264.1 isoprenylcysteine carboxylmethyltransferase family protein [Cyclobacteriaceae bacterium]
MAVLVLGWCIYFILHSVLAAGPVKEVFKKRWGKSFRYYRLGYVLFSATGVLLLLFLNSNIPGGYVMEREGLARYLSLLFAAFGVIVIKVAFREYGFSGFIGLAEERKSFSSQGILKSVRHPIYSGTILMMIGYWLFSPNIPTLVSVLCVFAYLPVGIYLEERKLIKQFGEEYIRYKRDVPALVPRLF